MSKYKLDALYRAKIKGTRLEVMISVVLVFSTAPVLLYTCASHNPIPLVMYLIPASIFAYFQT